MCRDGYGGYGDSIFFGGQKMIGPEEFLWILGLYRVEYQGKWKQ